MARKEIIIGIDLGTTNSVVSYMQEDGNVKLFHHQKEEIHVLQLSLLKLMEKN